MKSYNEEDLHSRNNTNLLSIAQDRLMSIPVQLAQSASTSNTTCTLKEYIEDNILYYSELFNSPIKFLNIIHTVNIPVYDAVDEEGYTVFYKELNEAYFRFVHAMIKLCWQGITNYK